MVQNTTKLNNVDLRFFFTAGGIPSIFLYCTYTTNYSIKGMSSYIWKDKTCFIGPNRKHHGNLPSNRLHQRNSARKFSLKKFPCGKMRFGVLKNHALFKKNHRQRKSQWMATFFYGRQTQLFPFTTKGKKAGFFPPLKFPGKTAKGFDPEGTSKYFPY